MGITIWRAVRSAAGLMVGAALFAAAAEAAPSTIYTNDFDGNINCGVTCGPIGGSDAALGTPAPFSGNERVTNGLTPISVTLSNLPAHDSVSLSFLAHLFNTWDGINCCTDVFAVSIDGTPVFQAIVAGGGGGTTDYDGDGVAPFTAIPAAVLLPTVSPLGLDLGNEPKLQSIPHTASSLTVTWFCNNTFAGCQGDDSMGIDNLAVSINAVTTPPSVPEPAISALVGLGLIGLAARRRKQTN